MHVSPRVGGAATDSPRGGEVMGPVPGPRGGYYPIGHFREHFADICWVGTRVHGDDDDDELCRAVCGARRAA